MTLEFLAWVFACLVTVLVVVWIIRDILRTRATMTRDEDLSAEEIEKFLDDSDGRS